MSSDTPQVVCLHEIGPADPLHAADLHVCPHDHPKMPTNCGSRGRVVGGRAPSRSYRRSGPGATPPSGALGETKLGEWDAGGLRDLPDHLRVPSTRTQRAGAVASRRSTSSMRPADDHEREPSAGAGRRGAPSALSGRGSTGMKGQGRAQMRHPSEPRRRRSLGGRGQECA
jgi:hypothetical protein